MSNFTATVTAKPTIKHSSLFFKAKIDDQGIDAVAFFKDLDTAFKDNLTTLQVGDIVAFVGRKKINKYTGKEELIIEGPAKEELTYEEAMAIPSKDLIPVDQRRMETKKYTFPDGKFFYSDGIDVWIKPQEKVKATYKFIEGYNRMVTLDKKLLPDWYSVQTAQELSADPIQKKLAEVFSTW